MDRKVVEALSRSLSLSPSIQLSIYLSVCLSICLSGSKTTSAPQGWAPKVGILHNYSQTSKVWLRSFSFYINEHRFIINLTGAWSLSVCLICHLDRAFLHGINIDKSQFKPISDSQWCLGRSGDFQWLCLWLARCPWHLGFGDLEQFEIWRGARSGVLNGWRGWLKDGGSVDGWMDGWTDGWMDGRTDGWMDGCVKTQRWCVTDAGSWLSDVFRRRSCSRQTQWWLKGPDEPRCHGHPMCLWYITRLLGTDVSTFDATTDANNLYTVIEADVKIWSLPMVFWKDP